MGKRLFRIFPNKIPSRIKDLINQEVNLVLKNNTTCHGILKKAEGDFCVLKDMLAADHKIKIQDIIEIIYDREAAF